MCKENFVVLKSSDVINALDNNFAHVQFMSMTEILFVIVCCVCVCVCVL